MTMFTKGVLLLYLTAVALAIPLSLLESAKEMRLKSPPRSNKVKRAQEVIMFGNQQNRGETRGYGASKNEKRAASDPDDNTLTDVATLPNILPQVEENGYDSNQLEAGNRVSDLDRVFQYSGGDPLYNLQLRNIALKEQLYNDPGINDMNLYSTVEARRKREAKLLHNFKLGLRNKRDLDLSPEEFLSLIKLWNTEHHNKVHKPRFGWPMYDVENEDYDSGESQEENELEPQFEFTPNGHWVDYAPHHSLGSDGLWQHQRKRFMVSKRNFGDEGLLQMRDTPSGHVPVYRRFML